jgi:hypothetical protein
MRALSPKDTHGPLLSPHQGSAETVAQAAFLRASFDPLVLPEEVIKVLLPEVPQMVVLAQKHPASRGAAYFLDSLLCG